jgi:hypothetical protein
VCVCGEHTAAGVRRGPHLLHTWRVRQSADESTKLRCVRSWLLYYRDLHKRRVRRAVRWHYMSATDLDLLR